MAVTKPHRTKLNTEQLNLVQPHKQPPSPSQVSPSQSLPITLRHPLQLILLLDRIRVAAPLGRVDQLLGQTLGHALHVAEGRLPGPDGEQRDGLVDAAERGDVDGLAADGAGGADTGGVFARAAVDDCVDGDLEGVRVRHDVDLWCSNTGSQLLLFSIFLLAIYCSFS